MFLSLRWRRITAVASRVFIQPFVQTNNKGTPKARVMMTSQWWCFVFVVVISLILGDSFETVCPYSSESFFNTGAITPPIFLSVVLLALWQSYYPYSWVSLHWHWGSRPSASEATLKNMGRSNPSLSTTTKQYCLRCTVCSTCGNHSDSFMAWWRPFKPQITSWLGGRNGLTHAMKRSQTVTSLI